jgi:hypothetical protein
MNILFYTATHSVPFDEFYSDAGNVMVFSNRPEHRHEFAVDQQGTDVERVLGLLTAEQNKLLFVPMEVRDSFLQKLQQHKQFAPINQWQTQPVEPFSAKVLGLIESDPLFMFYQEMNITEALTPPPVESRTNTVVTPGISPSDPVKENEINFDEFTLLGQFQLFFSSLRHVGALFDPMQGGILFVVFALFLLMTVLGTFSKYTTTSKLNEATQKLQLGDIEGAKQRAKEASENNPALVAIREVEMAQGWGGNAIPTSPTEGLTPPPTLPGPSVNKCYIIQGKDHLDTLVKKFYGVTGNHLIKRIIDASIRKKDNAIGIWNTSTNHIDNVGDTKPDKVKLKISWELVIPNPTQNQDSLAKCRFNQ